LRLKKAGTEKEKISLRSITNTVEDSKSLNT
jgi:hypothetical protein